MINKKKRILKLTGAVLACAVISACSSDDVSVPPLNSGTPSAGDADFSYFVSVGDSLTAGYADGALYLTGQENSFPNILSQQFAAVGGGTFKQPLVNDNTGGLLAATSPILDNNGVNCCEPRLVLNTVTEKPERLTDTPTTDIILNPVNGMYNNMGVPGAKSYHLGFVGYGNPANLRFGTANPYYVRFAADQANSSVIGDAAVQMPTFFTLWIGNNDVLSYALGGGTGVELCDPTRGSCGSDDITDPGVFPGIYAQLVGALTQNPATKGVLINVPDVSTIPYFTTVPYNPVPLDQATADQLNDAYAQYNAAIQGVGLSAEEVAKRTISFSAGQNAVVIEDETLTNLTSGGLPSIRQATASDLIVLPASSKIGTEMVQGDPTTVWGLGAPLLDADVLIPFEIAAINTARTAYNDAIKAAADANPNLVLYDAAAMMTELYNSGIKFPTGSVTSEFAKGGAFSLDGVHPTARGYALIANGIIDAINSGFNANVHKVDPVNYPTIFLK